MSELPQAESADPDAVQMALQAAQTLWSRGETTESLRWLKRAAESASDEGADLRSLQLAKAAAELRAKLFSGSSEAPASVRPRDSERPSGSPSGADAGLRSAAAAPESVRPEDSAPASIRPGSATQYVVHRPREAQRQLMGLSSTTLETAVQRNGSAPSVPSWSAGAETRRSSSPPPLPRTSLDDYEELEAEPDEDPDSSEAAWAVPAQSSWRALGGSPDGGEGSARRREADRDSSPRVATLPPPGFGTSLGSSPPPLPDAGAFSEDDEAMRAEQPTMFMPPKDERDGAGGRDFPPATEDPTTWDAEAHLSRWEAGSNTGTEVGWGAEARSSGWGVAPSAALGGLESQNTAAESVPAKLTARVHHQAVRVSFAPDARCPGQYVVRALREGEKAREGERIALLVALEPGVPLV